MKRLALLFALLFSGSAFGGGGAWLHLRAASTTTSQ